VINVHGLSIKALKEAGTENRSRAFRNKSIIKQKANDKQQLSAEQSTAILDID